MVAVSDHNRLNSQVQSVARSADPPVAVAVAVEQVERTTALADRRIALSCRTAQWTLAGVQSVAHCQEQYPAQLRKLDSDAPPVIHLTGNTALIEAEQQHLRPVLTEWAMSPRALSIISHTAAEIVELELTLAVSTAHEAGRRLLAETLELGRSAVALVDGSPLREAIKDPKLGTHLEDGNLLMISSHDPDVRVQTAQRQCERVVLALGGAHVDLRSGCWPRTTIQGA